LSSSLTAIPGPELDLINEYVTLRTPPLLLVKIPNPLLCTISEPNIVISAEPLKTFIPALPLLL
jgi:hypothetical protein